MKIINPTQKKEKLLLTDTLQEIKQYARDNYIPVALDDTIIFLKKVLKKHRPKNILEIGTAIGYSGSILLGECDDSRLTTIEIDLNRYELAKINFERQAINDRVIQILGDAQEEIKKLENKKEKFDFIFLDGPKGQYIYYLPILKNLMNENAILFSDDVLFMGLVQGEKHIVHKHRTMILRLRKYLEEINKDGLHSLIYQIGEGVALTVKNKEILDE